MFFSNGLDILDFRCILFLNLSFAFLLLSSIIEKLLIKYGEKKIRMYENLYNKARFRKLKKMTASKTIASGNLKSDTLPFKN